MPEFIYKASDRTGKIIEGSLTAGDEAAVVTKIRGMGYIPNRIGSVAGCVRLPSTLILNLKNPMTF